MTKMKISYLMIAVLAIAALGGVSSSVEGKGDNKIICTGSHSGLHLTIL